MLVYIQECLLNSWNTYHVSHLDMPSWVRTTAHQQLRNITYEFKRVGANKLLIGNDGKTKMPQLVPGMSPSKIIIHYLH